MSIPPPPDENLPAALQDDDDEQDDPELELPQKFFEILKDIPEPKREEIISLFKEEMEEVVEEMSMMKYSGPIPHPDILRGMEEVVPGAAAQIIKMAVDQSAHRREMEKHVITAQTKQSGRGQWLGFSIASIVIIASVYLIRTGHDVAGSVLGSIDLISLVSIFVVGKIFQKKDLEAEKKD